MKLLSFSPWLGLTGFITIGVLLSLSLVDMGKRATYKEFEFEVDVSKGLGKPPIFAYWILGTGRESEKILGLL